MAKSIYQGMAPELGVEPSVSVTLHVSPRHELLYSEWQKLHVTRGDAPLTKLSPQEQFRNLRDIVSSQLRLCATQLPS